MADVRDLNQLWENACARFEAVSGKQIDQAKKKTLEEVYHKLERNFDSRDREHGHEHQRLKTAGKGILQLLKLLGGIAAQGAGVVFGPANLCFNALSFLIDVPSTIAGFAANLRALFEEIQASFLQFEIYRDIEKITAIDPALLEITRMVMISFADICAIAIKFFGGSSFTQLLRKTTIAILDGGSDVKSKLDEFRQLTARQSRISNAVSLKNIIEGRNENQTDFKRLFDALDRMTDDALVQNKELKENVMVSQRVGKATLIVAEALQKDSNENKTRNKDREDVKKICERLLGKSEPPDNHFKRFEPIVSRCQQTAEKVERGKAYTQWAHVETSTAPILLIRGAGHSGKSSLACALMDRFRLIPGVEDASTKVSTAFYQFQDETKTLRQAALQDALKVVAVHLSESNVVVRKRILTKVDSNNPQLPSDAPVPQMLKELFEASRNRDELNIKFIVVLDAIDQLSEEQQTWMYEAIGKLESAQVRFIFTETTDTLEEESLGGTNSIFKIQMEEQNEADIRKFVKRKIEGENCFVEDETPGIKEWIMTIEDQLPRFVKGRFDEASNRMDQIVEAVANDSLDEIDTILHRDASENREQRFDMILDRLNKELKPKEIVQLNEILAWVVYATRPLTIEEGDAVMSLQNEGHVQRGLKDKITRPTGKYRRLFKISDGKIELRNTEPKQFSDTFQSRRIFEDPTDVPNDPSISMTIQIHHATRPQLQKFFWDLSRQTAFDQWPKSSTETDFGASSIISVNEVDAHLRIIRICFDVLQAPPEETSSILDEYVSSSLFDHLLFLIDNIKSLQENEKQWVVDELVSLFEFPERAKNHLGSDFLREGCWLKQANLEVVHRWLQIPCPKLKQRSQRWLKQALSGNQLHPFRKLASAIAHKWLCYDPEHPFYAYMWIEAYISQSLELRSQDMRQSQVSGSDQIGTADDKEQSAEGSWSDVMDTAAKIAYCANWAIDAFKMTKKSVLHHRLAGTYGWFGERNLELAALLEAKSFYDHDWTVLVDLSDAYAGQGKNDWAIQATKEAFAEARQRKEMTDDEKDRFLDELTRNASWFSSIGKLSDAEELLQEALPMTNGDSYQAHSEMIELLLKTGRVTEALDFVNEMGKEPSKTKQHEHLTKLSSMFIESSNVVDMETLEEIFFVSRNTETSQTIVKALEKALENEEGRTHLTGLHLISGLAEVLCRLVDADDSLHKAVEHWEKCFGAHPNGEERFHNNEALWAAKLCFTFYSRQALVLGMNPESEASFVGYRKKMERLAETLDVYGDQKPLSYPLASFYVSMGHQEQARSLLMIELRAGLTLLYDETTDNDDEGFDKLGDVLMHTDDELNALSALYLSCLCNWNIAGPPKQGSDGGQGDDAEQKDGVKKENESEEGDHFVQKNTDSGQEATGTSDIRPSSAKRSSLSDYYAYGCDGVACKKPLRWWEEGGFWSCTVCCNVNFCNDCLTKLHNGTLPQYVCSPDHKCIYLLWIEEYMATPEGHVRVGGQLVDGKRVGGEFMKIDAWRDGIRDAWTKTKEDGDDKDQTEDKVENGVNGEVKAGVEKDTTEEKEGKA